VRWLSPKSLLGKTRRQVGTFYNIKLP